jgi:two-component system sensor histidine kinase VicK
MNNPAQKLKQFAPKTCGRAAKSALQRFPGAKTRSMPEKLRLLLVENSIHDELSIVNELHCGGFEVSHARVETTSDFQKELKEKPWDVIICDYCLRDSDGVTMLQLYLQLGLDIPFIMVSAEAGEDLAVDALKAGANDYVMKQNLSRLVPAINRELQAVHERQIRRRTETTQAYLASVVESCNDAIIGETLDGTVVAWNNGAERLYGYTAAEMIGRSVSVLIPWYRPEASHETLEGFNWGEQVDNFVTARIRKDGSAVEVSLSISPIKDVVGRIIGASTVARDITLWKQEENERLSLIQDLTCALAIKINHVEPLKAAP